MIIIMHHTAKWATLLANKYDNKLAIGLVNKFNQGVITNTKKGAIYSKYNKNTNPK